MVYFLGIDSGTTNVKTAVFDSEGGCLLWIRGHDPERFARIRKVTLVHDYLVFRLTGEFVTVPSIQSSGAAKETSLPSGATVVAGGIHQVCGMISRLWNQIKAEVCGLPVRTSTFAETCCLGAAVLAGTVCGVYSTIVDGCRALVKLVEPLCPDSSRLSLYEDVYRRHGSLRTAVEPLQSN